MLIPTISLRKWMNSGQLQNSFDQITTAMGGRQVILDLGATRQPPQGSAELQLAALHNPEGGFAAWVQEVTARELVIPTLQWGDPQPTRAQLNALVELGRGLVLRFRRGNAWNLPQLLNIAPVELGGAAVLCILDFGQLQMNADLTQAASELVAVAGAIRQRLDTSDITFSLAASSFPVDFASINREHARIPIRERELFNLISAADVFNEPGVTLAYGDFASVFAAERGFARGGAPRVDYPRATRWTYYRREVDLSFVNAAAAVMADADWDDDLVIWGSNEIRRAASGDLDGLHYQRAWTAVRIHLHLHQQLHFGSGGLYETDDDWSD